jgi:DNA-binding transcriptional LysR family regulator
MPTIEAIRKMVQRNEGVAFLPHMCAADEIRQGVVREIKVQEMNVNRPIRLVYPAKRALSHAAQAFLEVVGNG